MNSTATATTASTAKVTVFASVLPLFMVASFLGRHAAVRGYHTMSSSVSPTTKIVLDLGSALPLLFILAFFGFHPTIRGHSIRVRRFGLLSFHDIQYSYLPQSIKPGLTDATARASLAHLHVTLHLPRLSDPRWCTLSFTSFTFADGLSRASCERGHIDLFVLPRASGHGAGPWISVVLDGLDIGITSSASTPGWVQRVRTDAARTLLTGTIHRCDYSRAAMHFVPPAHAPEEFGDEMVISLAARGLQIQNARDRLYDVKAIEWGCRRSWMEGGGAMWVVAEDARWTKEAAVWQVQTQTPGWRQALSVVMHIPHFVYSLVTDPATHAEVIVPSCRFQFSAFRVHDAELLRQGAMLAQERFGNMDGGFGDVLWGVLASVIRPTK